MAETYYIRLPFYLLCGATTRTVDIMFDNEPIGNIEVTGTDRESMNTFTFSVTKEVGTYQLKVLNKHPSDVSFSSVCLDDVWVSNNNTDFYSVILNYGKLSNGIVKYSEHEDCGFNPAIGASIYTESSFGVDIVLPDSDNFYKVYTSINLGYAQSLLDKMASLNETDTEAYTKISSHIRLMKERGFS